MSGLDGDRYQGPKEMVAGVGQRLWAFEAKPTEPGIKPRSPDPQAPAFPRWYKEGRVRPTGFEKLWAREGLLGIKKHQFSLRFCCIPHRKKKAFLDFKRMTSFFSYLHSPVCLYSPLKIANVC